MTPSAHALASPARSRQAPSQRGTPSPLPSGWDSFVVNARGGDLVQSTLWAAAKRPLGFEAHQLVARDDAGQILGCAQLLLRRMGVLGAVGYIARGPLLASGAEDRSAEVLVEIERAARRLAVRHLIIQPPAGGEVMADALAAHGYSADAPEVGPSATLLLDLAPDIDSLFAGTSASTRRSIRQAGRRGVCMRTGDAGDIELFHRLHSATAARRGFTPLSIAYLRHHWEALHAREATRLIFACHEGAPLAAIWLTAFGDVVTARLSGWTGEGAQLHGSAACEWEAIRWAKQAGYRTYDAGGIENGFARQLLAGEAMTGDARSPSNFKLAFGGQPTLFPTAWQRTLSPLARPIVRAVMAGLGRSDRLRRCIERLRKG